MLLVILKQNHGYVIKQIAKGCIMRVTCTHTIRDSALSSIGDLESEIKWST
jgi:hypothetical protein